MEIKDINVESFAHECINAINEKIKNLNKLNIVVVGKAGVGKSTLINSIFRGNMAETGLGRPVTKEIKKIERKDFPLAIYDTPGFELEGKQQNKVKDEILEIIDKGLSSHDINETIHCIWYCINVNSNRFDDKEIEWLRSLTESTKATRVPVIVILTQSCPKKKASEMKNLVEKENLDVIKVIPVLSQDMEFDEEYVAKAFGLDNLINVMSEALPEELQDTLQNLQKVSLDAKKKAAQAAVAASTAAAVAECMVPVPLADAAMLIPTQVAMITSITVIFGLEVNKSLLTGFVTSALGTAGTTFLGKTIAANFLKLIPVVGQGAGAAISGTTAGLLTTALGETYIKIMEQVYLGEIKAEDLYSDDGKETMSKLFKENLKKERASKV